MIRCLLLACVLMSGCIQSVATNAVIARTYNNNFQTCTISLNWTVDQLLEACGAPDQVVTTANKTSECLIYGTEAVTMVTGEGPPAYAACVESLKVARKSRNGNDLRRIISVIALRQMPGQPVPPPPAPAAPAGGTP